MKWWLKGTNKRRRRKLEAVKTAEVFRSVSLQSWSIKQKATGRKLLQRGEKPLGVKTSKLLLDPRGPCFTAWTFGWGSHSSVEQRADPRQVLDKKSATEEPQCRTHDWSWGWPPKQSKLLDCSTEPGSCRSTPVKKPDKEHRTITSECGSAWKERIFSPVPVWISHPKGPPEVSPLHTDSFSFYRATTSSAVSSFSNSEHYHVSMDVSESPWSRVPNMSEIFALKWAAQNQELNLTKTWGSSLDALNQKSTFSCCY